MYNGDAECYVGHVNMAARGGMSNMPWVIASNGSESKVKLVNSVYRVNVHN